MTSREPVFVDTVHLLGLFLVDDQWHRAAIAADAGVGNRRRFTSHGVFQEFLAHVSRYGEGTRAEAVATVRSVQRDESVFVVTHTEALVEAALSLYDGEFRYSRLSYQDCIAIQIMRDFGITEILTADQEFTLAGLTPLLRRYA